jgi:hypothetical protein
MASHEMAPPTWGDFTGNTRRPCPWMRPFEYWPYSAGLMNNDPSDTLIFQIFGVQSQISESVEQESLNRQPESPGFFTSGHRF